MSALFTKANEAITFWKDHVPNNTGEELLIGASTHFIAGSLYYQNPIVGLTIAAISATATLIQAAITPLFVKLSGRQRTDFPWTVEVLRGSLALIATVAAFYGIVKIQMISLCILLYTGRVLLTALASYSPFVNKLLTHLHLKASSEKTEANWMVIPHLAPFI